MSIIKSGTTLTVYYEDGSRRIIRPRLSGDEKMRFKPSYDAWKSLAEGVSRGMAMVKFVVS